MRRVPVEVTGITVYPLYQGFLLILKEKQGNRWLPIIIGQSEAQNISYILKETRPGRPLTFDLIGSLIIASGSRIDSVTVTDLRDSTFFAEVVIAGADGGMRRVDARPSDAIALALKMNAELFVADRVLEEAGQTEDLQAIPSDTPDRLRELNVRLQEAVDQEAYEEAARLRDKIRELQGDAGQALS
jgi:bifunctional DNase/RNase